MEKFTYKIVKDRLRKINHKVHTFHRNYELMRPVKEAG